MNIAINYLPDATVDDALNREIITLLTACFTKPQDTVFQTRRYFREPYPHRWIIRDERKQVKAMVKALSENPWPEADVYLPGPTF